jgi:ATP-binding cassette subfamily B multidrug efflux pump
VEVFKWIWGHIKPYRFKMLVGFISVLAVTAMNTISPRIAGTIVDKVIKGGEIGLLPYLIALMIGVTLLKAVVRYLYQVRFHQVSQDVIYEVRKSIYEKIQQLDFYFFDKTRTGEIMARMTGDLEAVRHFIAWVIYNIFENLAMLVFALVVLSVINLPLTLIMLSVAPALGILTYKMGIKVKPAFSEIREQFAKLNSVVKENISGNRVVKALAKEQYEITKFTMENEAFREKQLDATKIWSRYLPMLESLAGLFTVFLILFGGIFVVTGKMTLGELVTFNGLAWALNSPMRMAGYLINDVQNFAASADKIKGLLETEPRIENAPEPVLKDRLEGRVEFRDVCFCYGDEMVLKNVSFSVEPGETVAILGPTGCGKTSIINLICRYYEATSGQVLIDGIDVKEIDLRVLRKNISVAMQDVFLFSNTVEGNIAYGVPDAPFENIRHAAQIADADEFIMSMPEEYSTIIGERGVGLSGGQKQRVSLARALITEPAILILDDTTSSVDMETERKIYSALDPFCKGRTTFIIAHRISTVKNADRILVVMDGRIIESGSHQELIGMKGYYYKVYMDQIGVIGDDVMGAEGSEGDLAEQVSRDITGDAPDAIDDVPDSVDDAPDAKGGEGQWQEINMT